MSTTSEDLFDDYCANRGYAVEELAAGPSFGKTADRLVSMPDGQVIVEIKELAPSKDDVRQFRELEENNWTLGGGTPGRRVFELIRRAAPQLKRYANRRLPSVLVTYNNIVLDGYQGGTKHLTPSFIDFGMYGLQTVLIAPDADGGPHYVPVGIGRGGRRQMTPEDRDYISAVAVLGPPETGPSVVIYHNYFAAVPLPSEMFRGGMDQHFRKPGHPNQTPQMWDKM